MSDQNVEHERKFLVADSSVLDGSEGEPMVQGYLLWAEESHVRVRTVPRLDYHTITVKHSAPGVTRREVECSVSGEVAAELLALCGSGVIFKTRHPIPGPAGTWTIDVFERVNYGLVLAEIELSDPETEFEVPAWCGAEVTQDERYYNEYLARHPYRSW